MLAYIEGKLLSATTSDVIVLTGGLGYRVAIPVNVYTELPPVGSPLALHTVFVVREQLQALYGFLTPESRDLFAILIELSGVGPKTAMSLLGHLNMEALIQAVEDHDMAPLTKVPGIGRKTAERLLLEMRDKLPSIIPQTSPHKPVDRVNVDPRTRTISDAMGALINLGYTQSIAERALKRAMENLPEDVALPQLITAALKLV